MDNNPKILPNPDNSVRIEDDFEPETHVVYADMVSPNDGVIQLFGYPSHIPSDVSLKSALEGSDG